MADIAGLGNINGLIAQLMSVERAQGPIALYQNDQQDLTLRSATLSDLRTDLTALNAQAQALMQPGSLSPFQAVTVTSSNAAVATATATSSAAPGTHTLFVSQLAKQSVVVSNQLSQAGTDVVTAVGAGTMKFSVPGAANVNVTVNTGDTNNTILANMAAAINASGAAVTAAIVTDTPSTARLVLTSKNSGSANAVALADVTGTLLASTGTSSGVASSGTAGGYLYAASALDATFTLDGLAMTRGSNTVSDALTGVTVNLLGVQAGGAVPVTLSVGPDQSGIQAKVQGFLDSYNTLIKFLKDRTGTTVTATTGATGNTQVQNINRGALDAEPTYLNLLMNLRGDVGGRITTAAAGGPASLSEIGISAAADGTLSITDSAKFANALNANAANVAALFNSSDGIASRVSARLAGFIQTGGVVDGSLAAVTSRLTSINSLIQEQEQLLKFKEDILRQQLLGLQQVVAQIQMQQDVVQAATSTGVIA